MRFPFTVFSVLIGALLFAAAGAARGSEAPRAPFVELSRNGEAMVPIVLSPKASEKVRALARDFADGLHRITGAKFEIREEAGESGIFIGTSEEWPGLLPEPPEGRSPVLTREDYRLKTEGAKFYIVGRSPLAVQDAIWDYFYRVGFRQFFPGPKWEVWPHQADLTASFDDNQSPDYYTRHISFGRTSKEMGRLVDEWKIRNRMVSGFALATSHVYGKIIARNKKHFEAHPEDIVANKKLDPSRSSVLEVVARDALRQFEQNPQRSSISMDPSDGGGWRADSPLGSPSNQAVTLANHAARAVQEKFPGRKVGIYAYNQHSPPPEIEVDPNVIVSIATAFIKGGYTVDELMEGWRAKGAEIGIREYLSVWSWDQGKPGRSRAATPSYLTQTLSRFHEKGTRYWISEASNSWGPHGFGYYFASRALWNVADAARWQEIADDFYLKAFEEAAPEMKEFYERCIFTSGKVLFSEDLVARMYRSLDAALKKPVSPAVRERLLDLVRYARFVEVTVHLDGSSGDERAAYLEELSKAIFSADASGMVGSFGFSRKGFKGEKDGLASRRDFRATPPMTEEELLAALALGIEKNRLFDFETVSFSRNLVPYEGPAGNEGNVAEISIRGRNIFNLHADRNKKGFDFEITGGLAYDVRGPVYLRLFAEENPELGTPVVEMEVPADKVPHAVHLDSPFEGHHRLEVLDNRNITRISWPKGQRVTFEGSPEVKTHLHSPYQVVFYVPEGTKVVAGYAKESSGRIRFADGRDAYIFDKGGAGYFSVPVPKGEDGKVWRMEGATTADSRLLLTVPPYFARTASELLIPAETVGKRREFKDPAAGFTTGGPGREGK